MGHKGQTKISDAEIVQRNEESEQMIVRDLSQEYTTEAVNTLRTIMRNSKSGATARINAAKAILAYGWGKPPQQVVHSGNTGQGLTINILKLSDQSNQKLELPEDIEDACLEAELIAQEADGSNGSA